jgi:hypothetical protein
MPGFLSLSEQGMSRRWFGHCLIMI